MASLAAATSRPGELFGGAMQVLLPRAWQDMNDLGHPVPDNQEVYCEPSGGEGQSLVFEIVERTEVDDGAAPKYFFDDIAEAAGAAAFELICQGRVPVGRSRATTACIALGHMMLPKTGVVGAPHGVDVGVLAFRFAEDETDVLVTLNAPAMGGSRLARGVPVAEALASPGLGPLRDITASLVVDRGLFG